ncbi:MAG TPA: hypothetical protein VJ908_06135 [Wenzhouxiangellaceae bacterium]|nr:hypothetical protein [Wenzhouxiangellaceae bacterium]
MTTASRIGFRAAAGTVAVGVLYAIAVGLGIAQAGFDRPILDPVLWIMEVLTLMSAVLILILLAAIHALASPERNVFSAIALCCGAAFAALTGAVHFVALTAGRQTGFTVLEWPSTLYAVELLAWDIFLGLALLFAAPVFTGTARRTRIRWMLSITGGLCMAGAIGPIVGDMAVQRIGIVGYGVLLPVTCVLLALLFRKDSHG